MCLRKLGRRLWVVAVFLPFVLPSRTLEAVVGEPKETYPEIQRQDLEEFHSQLTREETAEEEVALGEDFMEVLRTKQAALRTESDPEVKEVLQAEIDLLKDQLLQLPKRDRISFELTGDYSYDSNIQRLLPRFEKGDSVFETGQITVFDLSGRKTDLRSELGLKKQWNIHFSEKDFWQFEERLRYRRKYLGKLTQSANSRASRNSEKTIELDENKIRWDIVNQTAVNWAFSKKLSLNLDVEHNKRLFVQEAFDEDSTWQLRIAPSGFWHFTPKSRMNFGYKYGFASGRQDTDDFESHDFRIGYFGQITKKSSASIDISYSYQIPRSTTEADRTRDWTLGAGYIWQMTPKTQMTVEATRSLINSTSDLASGTTAEPTRVIREDQNVVSDNVSLSFNSELKRQITAVLTSTVSHVRQKTLNDGIKESETRQFTFPISLGVIYKLSKWVTFNIRYTFSFRTGDEHADTYRSHLWRANVRIVF